MEVIENERTANAQKITRQPDGPGKRIGKKGEISFLGKLAPGRSKSVPRALTADSSRGGILGRRSWHCGRLPRDADRQ